MDKPGLEPPPGVIPNFSDAYTIQPYIVLTVMICIVVTTTLVFVRMYTKYRIVKSLGWEDCKWSGNYSSE